MKRIIVIPAIFAGCLIVVWVGTVAAAHIPTEAGLSPKMTVNEQAGQTINDEAKLVAGAKPTDNPKICSLPPRYPAEIQQWCHFIESAASQTGLPVDLIAAVMLQESGGDPLSYSSSGAVGLMQIMPCDGIAADFICINGPCFASRPTIEELQDPAFNINYGSRILADLYAKYGTYREALFHYGPMNIGYRYADLVIKIWDAYG